MAKTVDQDGYPSVCCLCGVRIVKTKDEGGLRFYMDDATGEALSWHRACEIEHGSPLLGWPGQGRAGTSQERASGVVGQD